jgi:hypothetical protein
MLSLRTHAIITGALFALIVLLAVAGNILEATAIIKRPEQPQTWLLALFFTLFLAFGYSAIPLMLKVFLAGQAWIGNGNVGIIKAMAAHQTATVAGFWLFCTVGLALAVPAAIDDGAFGPAPQRALKSFVIGKSKGTLAARPGMTIAAMLHGSSLPIDQAMAAAARGVPLSADTVFDFELPGSAIRFARCRYYFITTAKEDPQRIDTMSIGTSTDAMSHAELDGANAALRARLAADGWLTGHEEYRDELDRRLHGRAARGDDGWVWLQGETILRILTRRMDDPARDEDTATAGRWIQFVELSERKSYPGIERYVFAPWRS